MTPIPVAAESAEDLARLHALAFAPPEAWGPDAVRLMLSMPGAFGCWAPGAGFLLARAVAEEAEVLTLAVAPPARRRGIGAALVGCAMAEAAARGAAVLFLEVSAENSAARSLYAGLGFAEVGRRRRYYPDGTDALVLSRRLSEEEAG